MDAPEDLRVTRPRDLAPWGDDELVWLALSRVWDAAVEPGERRIHRALPASVTGGQAALYALWWLIAEINEGGFHQFLWSSAGGLAKAALEALLLVGAREPARLLAECLDALPAGTLLSDPAGRQEALSALEGGGPDLFAGKDLAFHAAAGSRTTIRLAAAWVRAHPEEFFSG